MTTMLTIMCFAAATQVAAAPSTPQVPLVLGRVTLSQAVVADGKPLPAGTYQVRLSSTETPTPVVGQSPDGARWVEFVRGTEVVARELATVIAAADLPTVVDSGRTAAPRVRVQELKGGDYVRVWLSTGDTHYLIHLTRQQ